METTTDGKFKLTLSDAEVHMVVGGLQDVADKLTSEATALIEEAQIERAEPRHAEIEMLGEASIAYTRLRERLLEEYVTA